MCALPRYSTPIYTNVKYPWTSPTSPFVPNKNPTGIYRTSFNLPPPSSLPLPHNSYRYSLYFAGVAPCFYLYVNGRKVGYSSDGCLPSEFDVTEYLSGPENNTLEVVVPRWCCFSYLEDQDHWWLSGIYRGVELKIFEKR